MAELTAAAREARAKHWDERARELRVRAELHDAPSLREIRERRVKWYEARAKGERERFLRAGRCGQPGGPGMRITCKGCGTVHEGPQSCGAHFACARCRDAWAGRLRRKFIRSRAAACRVVGWRMRGAGAWSEKLVTLTVPHEGLAQDRIKWAREAWPIFLRSWRAALLEGFRARLGKLSDERPRTRDASGKLRYAQSPRDRAAKRELDAVRWYKVTEWTPGDDGEGHPHHHFWAICPWVDREQLRELWRAALGAAGLAVGFVAVDVRRIHGGRRSAAELVKYFTKDTQGTVEGGNVRGVAPAVYATAFRLMHGTRRTQGARGFIKAAGVQPCQEEGCKAALGWNVELLPPLVWEALRAELEAMNHPGLARAAPRDGPRRAPVRFVPGALAGILDAAEQRG